MKKKFLLRCHSDIKKKTFFYYKTIEEVIKEVIPYISVIYVDHTHYNRNITYFII